jgi:sodium-coupled neutral amino acid transporter 2
MAALAIDGGDEPLLDESGIWEEAGEEGGLQNGVTRMDTPFTSALKAEAHPVVRGGEASLRSTIFNAINAIIGAGVLALPYSMRLDGALVGIVLVFIVAGLSERSAAMLLWASDATNERLYAGIGKAIGGRVLETIVDVTVILQNLGLLIGYVVVCGDLLPEFIAYASGHSDAGEGAVNWEYRGVVLALLAGLVFLPLSSLKSLDALRFTTLVGLVCVLVYVCVTIVLGSMAYQDTTLIPCGSTRGDVKLVPESFVDVLQSAPLIFFSFVAHNTMLLLYGEMKRQKDPERESRWPNKRSKMLFVIRVALGMCAVLYSISAGFSYTMFRDETAQDVFVDFGPKAFPFMAWIKLAYAVVIIFSFPIIAFALRRSLHNLLFGTSHQPTTFHAITESLGIVTLAALVGIFVPQISTVFGLTGALTATNVMYIFPASFFIVLYRRWHAQKEDPTAVMSLPEPPKGLYPWAVLVLAVGIFVFLGSTTGVIIGIVNPTPAAVCAAH